MDSARSIVLYVSYSIILRQISKLEYDINVYTFTELSPKEREEVKEQMHWESPEQRWYEWWLSSTKVKQFTCWLAKRDKTLAGNWYGIKVISSPSIMLVWTNLYGYCFSHSILHHVWSTYTLERRPTSRLSYVIRRFTMAVEVVEGLLMYLR